jgi:hypothetical protein
MAPLVFFFPRPFLLLSCSTILVITCIRTNYKMKERFVLIRDIDYLLVWPETQSAVRKVGARFLCIICECSKFVQHASCVAHQIWIYNKISSIGITLYWGTFVLPRKSNM